MDMGMIKVIKGLLAAPAQVDTNRDQHPDRVVQAGTPHINGKASDIS